MSDFFKNLRIKKFLSASKRGNIDTIDLLLNKGIDINSVDKNGQTALIKAVEGDQLKVIDFLIKKKINIEESDKKKMTALTYAITSGNKKIILRLLEVGKKIQLIDYKKAETCVLLFKQELDKSTDEFNYDYWAKALQNYVEIFELIKSNFEPTEEEKLALEYEKKFLDAYKNIKDRLSNK